MRRSKLCLKNIYELAELCLSEYYFLWNNEDRILINSGPIGTSFMAVSSQNYDQNIEHKAIAEALTLKLATKMCSYNANVSHAWLKSKEQSRSF